MLQRELWIRQARGRGREQKEVWTDRLGVKASFRQKNGQKC